MTALSYTHGTSGTPLLGDTIGADLLRTVAAWPDREALVDVGSGRRWTWSTAPAPWAGCCRTSRSRSSTRPPA
ncbi:hypothetical protein [Streptomyces sp. NPDC004976]